MNQTVPVETTKHEKRQSRLSAQLHRFGQYLKIKNIKKLATQTDIQVPVLRSRTEASLSKEILRLSL